MSLQQRSAILLRFHDLVLARQDEVLDLIQLESGKARRHASEEVVDVALVSRYYANTAARYLCPQRRRGALPLLTATWEYRHPLGVVGVIAPWNYPLTLGISDALPALIAGNGVVIKPDGHTPYSALWAVELLEQAGLPPGLVQVVTGSGAKLGPHLIDRVDYVMFTGSTRTGRTVARQAAERLIGCSMELGGKNAMLVLRDAEIGKAVAGAERALFSNAGQLCIAIERLYVDEAIAAEYVRRLVERTRRMRLGSELAYGGDGGWWPAIERGLRAGRLDDEIAVALAEILRAAGTPAAWVTTVPSARLGGVCTELFRACSVAGDAYHTAP